MVTFVEHVRGTEFVEKYVYHTVWFCCLWGVLAALAVVVLASPGIVVAWLLPFYLGGSHDYIFMQQERIYASHSRH